MTTLTPPIQQTYPERQACQAMREALRALTLADGLASEADYGSEVCASLASAKRDLAYALDVAEGRV
jgi:hypothetical protein